MLNKEQIKEIIPQREPFLMIDEVEANSYKSMQARAKATSMTKSGRIRSKKRYGKSMRKRIEGENTDGCQLHVIVVL